MGIYVLAKYHFFVCYSPVGLMDLSPIGYQGLMLSQPTPWVRSLKVGALDIWSKPFALQGESFLILWHSARNRVYGETVSRSFLCILM